MAHSDTRQALAWATLCSNSTPHAQTKGHILFRQGFPAREVYAVESGLVRLSHLSKDGRELTIDLLGFPSIIGPAWVIAETPAPVTATVFTPGCLRSISRETFTRLLKTDASLSWYVLNLLSAESERWIRRIGRLVNLSARERLEELVGDLIKTANLESEEMTGEVGLRLPFEYREMAAMIAVSPEHLSRILRVMEAEGVIRRSRGTLIVRGLAGIRQSPPGKAT